MSDPNPAQSVNPTTSDGAAVGAVDGLPPGIPRVLDQGRYAVEALLGEGSSGDVLAARDTLLDRPVAIKRLPPVAGASQTRGAGARNHARGDDEDTAARQLLEARAVARLANPHIVACFDVFEEDEQLHLVLERVSGPTLRQWMNDHGPLEIDALIRLGEELASALGHAHANGIIHRDLKPENILLTPDGTAKLTDFGIARATGTTRLTIPGQVLGTPAYVAPEQAIGQPIDGRADLYGLGCVLYEATTGMPPFEDDNPLVVVSQHLHAAPSPPSTRRIGLPRAWDAMVLRLLAKQPEKRFDSAEALVSALRSLRPSADETPAREGADVLAPEGDRGQASQPAEASDFTTLDAVSTRMQGRPRRILVVEDDSVLADLVKLVMENAGYEVVLAHDGFTAWEQFQRQPPDLVLMDLMLPGPDGLALLRHIRALPTSLATVPVVVLTGRDDEKSTVGALDAGADEYLVKPLSPDELLARIRAVLRRADRTPSSV
jgi:CheY-like chemotaxis protein